MASQAAPKGYDGDVTVYIRDINEREVIPNRVIYLQPPTFEKKIGRGSHAEQDLHPQSWNTWFGSRVMSRDHAILRADPNSKTLTVEDTRSMHGTFVAGVRIAPGQKVVLKEQDKIQFGTEIVRGDQTYKPLETVLVVDFDGDDLPPRPHPGPSQTPKNTFRVDSSDEENEDDDEIEVVYESITSPLSATKNPSRTFSVPDSETSDSCIDQAVADDSAPSSPMEISDVSHRKTIQWPMPNDTVRGTSDSFTNDISRIPGSSIQDALNVDADEDDVGTEQNRENVPEAKETEVASARSDEDNYSSDEYPFHNDEYEEDDESHVSDFEEEWNEDLDEDDWENGMATTRRNMTDTHGAQSVTTFSHRQPSPSDCALPRSSWYPQNTHSNGLPTIHNIVEHAPAQPVFTPQPWSTAHPLLMPQYQPLYCGNANWAHSDNTPHFSTLYDHSFGGPPLSNMPPSVPPRPYVGVLSASTIHDMKEPNPVSILTNDEALTKSSKVSINAIIEDVQAACTPSSNKHKRKADEISSDMALEVPAVLNENQKIPVHSADTSVSGSCSEQQSRDLAASTSKVSEVQSVFDNSGEKLSPGKKSVTFSAETEIIEPDSGRPTKWAKHQHQPEAHGGQFFKYFATALAGVTVGAVGTVFGLAALPADYFV